MKKMMKIVLKRVSVGQGENLTEMAREAGKL